MDKKVSWVIQYRLKVIPSIRNQFLANDKEQFDKWLKIAKDDIYILLATFKITYK